MSYTLKELDAKFLTRNLDGTWRTHLNLQEAEGVEFLCPKCFEKNKGPVGTHMVICWFEGKVPDDLVPGPGRWTPQGEGIHDLTFVPGKKKKAVSVLLTGGCGWHGHVKNGKAG